MATREERFGVECLADEHVFVWDDDDEVEGCVVCGWTYPLLGRWPVVGLNAAQMEVVAKWAAGLPVTEHSLTAFALQILSEQTVQ